MRALEHRIPPPLLMLLIAAVMALALRSEAPAFLAMGWRWGLAGLFFIAAGVFAFPAITAFGKAGTTIDPVQVDRASTLVTTGIYGVTRNPMYVALSLLLCAWAAWLAQPPALIGPIAYALFITRFQIIPEERVLTAKFGQAYTDYRQSVRRWL